MNLNVYSFNSILYMHVIKTLNSAPVPKKILAFALVNSTSHPGEYSFISGGKKGGGNDGVTWREEGDGGVCVTESRFCGTCCKSVGYGPQIQCCTH